MNSVRLWILLLAVVSFLAGGAGGFLFGLEMPRSDPVPFAAFAEPFADEFDLDSRERRILRMAMREYDLGLDELKSRIVADELAEDLIRLGLECRAHIRDYVLPPDRLEEFDTRVAGLFPDSPLGS